MSDKGRNRYIVPSKPSTDFDETDNSQDLSITVGQVPEDDSSDHASFSFIPLSATSSPIRKRRSLSGARASELSASPSGASTPTGKLDAASKKKVRETYSDIDNAYFRNFWSRYLKGFERVMVSDLLNKFLKDLATTSSSYDSGEAFSSEELIKFFRPAPRGKGDKLREALDPDGSLSIGPLKLNSVLRRFGKQATSRDILLALAEGGGPRIWPLPKSNSDCETSLRRVLRDQLQRTLSVRGITVLKFDPSSGASTELLKYLQDSSAVAQMSDAGDSKPSPSVYVNVRYCNTWQEALWEIKVQLGFEGATIGDVVHHFAQYMSCILASNRSAILVIDNTTPIVASWLFRALSPFAKDANIFLVVNETAGLSLAAFNTTVDIGALNANDQLAVAEYLLQQEASKAESIANNFPDSPSRVAVSSFDSKTVKTIATSCSRGNLSILKFVLSCEADVVRRWIQSYEDHSQLSLKDLPVFDDAMLRYLFDLAPILLQSSLGLCQWFYSDAFEACTTTDKFTQDECLSILRSHGLLEIDKNLLFFNLSSYLYSLIQAAFVKPRSVDEESVYVNKIRQYWGNVYKYLTNLAASLSENMGGSSLSHDSSTVDPLLLSFDTDIASAAFGDRYRGPAASLSPILPQIRILLLCLIVDETADTNKLTRDISWTFLFPSTSVNLKPLEEVLVALRLPADLRAHYLLSEDFIAALLKVLHMIGTDEEILPYLLKLREAQALVYQDENLQNYSVYPVQHLTPGHVSESERVGGRASELVIMAIVTCCIRMRLFDEADQHLSRSLPASQNNEIASDEKSHELSHKIVHQDSSTAAKSNAINIFSANAADDVDPSTVEFGHTYVEKYIFPENSMAEMQGTWLKGASYHLRCIGEDDSFTQLSMYHPFDKKVLQRLIDEQGENAKPPNPPIWVLDTLREQVEEMLTVEIEANQDSTNENTTVLSSEAYLFIYKLKTILLRADNATTAVLSSYSKRNINLWLSQKALLESNAACTSLLTTLFRDITAVDTSGVRRVEELLKQYNDVLEMFGESFSGTAAESQPLVVDVLDELLVLKIKCLILVRGGDLMLSMKRYSEAQKLFERVTSACKDVRYKRFVQHSLMYAQAISGLGLVLANSKPTPGAGPSPQTLLAIEMFREAYHCCNRATPYSAARYFQLQLSVKWSTILIAASRFEAVKILLGDEIRKVSTELEVLTVQNANYQLQQVTSIARAFLPSLIHYQAGMMRESQQTEIGGAAGNEAAAATLKTYYESLFDLVKRLIGEYDVMYSMIALSYVEQLSTPSTIEADTSYLDDEEDDVRKEITDETYMSQASLLVTAMDILRAQYSERGCDALLHGITLILRRQAKLLLRTQRTQADKLKMAKATLENVMDVFRDMGGIGFSVDLADVQAELGLILASSNEQSEATSLFTQAIDLYRQLYGDVDIRVAEYSYRKAVALQDLKLYEDSEPFVKEAINIFNLLPPGVKKGKALAACYTIKGFLQQELDEFEDAKESYKIALQICGRMFGKDGIELSPHAAKIFNNLASVATSMGDLEEARSLYEATVVMLKKQGKDVSIQMLIVLENLEQLLRGEGLYENADFFKSRVEELTEQLCVDMEKREELLKQRQKQREELFKKNKLENGGDEDGQQEEEEEEGEEEEKSSGYKCNIM